MGLKYNRYTPMAIQYIVEQQAMNTVSVGMVIRAILTSQCYIGMSAVHVLRGAARRERAGSARRILPHLVVARLWMKLPLLSFWCSS